MGTRGNPVRISAEIRVPLPGRAAPPISIRIPVSPDVRSRRAAAHARHSGVEPTAAPATARSSLVRGWWHRLNRVTMKVRIRENRRNRGARARNADLPRRAEVPRTRRRPHIRRDRARPRAAPIAKSVGQVTSGGRTCGRSTALIAASRD